MKTALVLGHAGQDGQLLIELLQSQNFRILGIGRDTCKTWGTFPELNSQERISINDPVQVSALLSKIKPDEVYHLAAFHHSSQDRVEDNLEAFNQFYQVNVHSLLCLLEGIRFESPQTRLFYAASSHVFGNPGTSPQTESTPFNANSEYGITKVAGIQCCRMFRKRYGVFASCGILYNHESKYRKENFLSKKLIKAALNIYQKKQNTVILGNLDAQIDWGYAPDFVRAMQSILSLSSPDDFILSTGQLHSVRDFASLAFHILGLDWKNHVQQDENILTRQESAKIPLLGDNARLRNATNWKPSMQFQEMIIQLMKDEAESQGIRIPSLSGENND